MSPPPLRLFSAFASTLRCSISKPHSCYPSLKTISRQSSTSSGDEDDEDDTIPNSKRLRRIKDGIREMSLLFQQVMLENEDDDEEEEEKVELEPPQEQHHQQNGDTTEVNSDRNVQDDELAENGEKAFDCRQGSQMSAFSGAYTPTQVRDVFEIEGRPEEG